MRYLFSLILTMLLISPLWAEDEIDSPCMQKAETNEEIRGCNEGRLKQLDTALNRLWRELYPPLPSGTHKKILLEEQRKWIAFKDSSCVFWHYGFGTTGRDMFFYDCRAKIIEQRIKELRQISSISLDNLIRPLSFQRCSGGVGSGWLEDLRKSTDPEDNCAVQLKRLEKSDDKLNQAWRELRTKWNNEDNKNNWDAILNEQRKWIAFKEKACEYRWHQASIWECAADLINQRINELQEIKNFEN